MKTVLTWKTLILMMFAIGCVTGLEIVALSNGIDGALLTSAIGAIVAIPAYVYGKVKKNG